jgi:hypothetical protein
MRLAAILALLPFLSSQDKAVSVDMELLKSRHIAVQVKINGEGPFRLIFDTGAPVTLVSRRAAKAAGLRGGLTGATARTFEIGGVKQEDLAVTVFDHPTVKALAEVCGDLDGIVGFNFFSRYDLAVDYRASKLSFAPCRFRPADTMARMQQALLGGRDRKRVQDREATLGLALRGEEPVVESVAPGSAAEAAGLRPGDRIIELDGRWIDSAQDLFDAAALLPAGEKVVLKTDKGERKLRVRRGF